MCCLATLCGAVPVTAQTPDPWVITGSQTITEPMEVGDVIVIENGSLLVDGVPAPGLVLSGNLWAVDNAVIELRDSVVRFASTYHGQYSLAGVDAAQITVDGCDYRVTDGIQHGLVVGGNASLDIRGSQLSSVQLSAIDTATISASASDGAFEVILQGAAHIELEDIPATPDGGSLWVWVEMPTGSRVTYSPPLPGLVDAWTFPPPDAVGVPSSCELTRCHVSLWPMLVWDGAELELRDIPEASWVVVGLHLPTSTSIRGLRNQLTAADTTLPLEHHSIRLVNASIDTWNLYPWNAAEVEVTDCTLGEILAFDTAHVTVRRTLIDGSGGFLGTTNASTMELWESTTTCTVQAVEGSTLEMHRCAALPYPADPSGAGTRFGAYDAARLLADHTPIQATPVLGGDGLIAVTWIANPLTRLPGAPVELIGSVALFSLDGGPTLTAWQLWEHLPTTGERRQIATGDTAIDEAPITTWTPLAPARQHRLEIVLVDSNGRQLTGVRTVPDRHPRPFTGGSR